MVSGAPRAVEQDGVSHLPVMRLERVGLSVLGAIALFVVVIALATVWLFLTNPVTLASAISEGEISPLVRDLADVLLRALEGLLKYL